VSELPATNDALNGDVQGLIEAARRRAWSAVNGRRFVEPVEVEFGA
jgi:hypothetical protein